MPETASSLSNITSKSLSAPTGLSISAPTGEMPAVGWWLKDRRRRSHRRSPHPGNPSGRRLRSRGFNQAQLLANQVGPIVGIEVNDHILRRERRTRPQVDLKPSERKENVYRAFSAESGAVRGKRILLIDDVFTTGATLISAAGTLLEAGADSVSAYCLARAVH